MEARTRPRRFCEEKFPDGHFLGWTPGQSPRVSPRGMSWRVEPGSDLVIEMHLMPAGATEPVRASVGLFFTDEPPTQTPYRLRIGRQDLDIVAGQRDYVNADSYKLPVDVDVLGVQHTTSYSGLFTRRAAARSGAAYRSDSRARNQPA